MLRIKRKNYAGCYSINVDFNESVKISTDLKKKVMFKESRTTFISLTQSTFVPVLKWLKASLQPKGQISLAGNS